MKNNISKYNPLKKMNINTKSKKDKKSDNLTPPITSGNKYVLNRTYSILYELILYLFIIAITIIVVRYIYDKLFKIDIIPKDVIINKLSKNLKVIQDFDINLVPGGNKLLEPFQSNIISDKDAESSFYQLSPNDQSKLCMNKSEAIIGYRNAMSGATFRFQKVDPTVADDKAKYFLLGNVNNGKVIQVDDEDNLTLEIKSSDEGKQHFVRKTLNEPTFFYFVPNDDANENMPVRALQYEYDHLSLRLTMTTGPYEGQKFVKMEESEQDKIIKQGVSYGLSVPHLDRVDLAAQRPINYVVVPSGGSSNISSVQQQLQGQIPGQQQSSTEINEAVERVLSAFNEYKEQQMKNTSGGVLGNEPLKINLNLNRGSNENFVNTNNSMSNLEAFENLRGVQGNDDVRSRLNIFLSTQSSATFGNNNLSGSGFSISNLSQNDIYRNRLQQAAAGTSFRGCPLVNSKEYINKRHLSKCYGCNPDSSLQ